VLNYAAMKGELKSRAANRQTGARSKDQLQDRRVPYLALWKRAALSCGALTLAAGASGCWVAAMQLAPVAIQAAEAIGGGVVNLAAGSMAAAHQSHQDKNMPPPDSDVCDELSLEIPMLVELKTDATGITRYRELSLVGADLDPEWAAMPNQDTKDGGWKLASNFTKMNFQPPLQSELTANSISYVAYAPADAHDATEQDQLNALAIGFGSSATGTFTWNERSFRYALVHKLPCFPPPPEPKS
jgi:hypothetical protein